MLLYLSVEVQWPVRTSRGKDERYEFYLLTVFVLDRVTVIVWCRVSVLSCDGPLLFARARSRALVSDVLMFML